MVQLGKGLPNLYLGTELPTVQFGQQGQVRDGVNTASSSSVEVLVFTDGMTGVLVVK